MAVVATMTWAAGRRLLGEAGFDGMSERAGCDYIIKHDERKGWQVGCVIGKT
jgi:hypothetical protein